MPDLGQGSSRLLYAALLGVQPPSVAATATPESGSAPLTVDFTATVSGGTAPFTYEWTFGDGGTSTDQNPDYTYLTPGTYSAYVTVTDALGDTVTAIVSVTVARLPAGLYLVSRRVRFG